MSKNVAVFVDVANIFYAAKAAGVDIDYVTLLKAAIAGRDFVRAYAYTGLDPENENQRQFHSFLARNNYKVVSKDIRKYGDGRIKANLDIELVVDMMKLSRNLDVAVVISGDGDFAPAIRAVQEMGVRVEVISFRGNTSSDLIEAADVFTDIIQLARVETGSSRSGRRVAAEGDLSMTEVPDKETEGLARRRRGRGRGERVPEPRSRTGELRDRDRGRIPAAADVVVARTNGGESVGLPGNLIVLPGEKLSRVARGGVVSAPADVEQTAFDDVDDLEDAADALEDQLAELPAGEGVSGEDAAEGRRRRRRRGGRGRGRGRGGEAELGGEAEPGGEVPIGAVAGPAEDPAEGVADLDLADEDELEEPESIRMPQHSTFGSVWDSQLGVPTQPILPTGQLGDDEFEDEPEIPEYLLAERRQRGQVQHGRCGPNRMGGRMGGRNAGYQSAVDRERYGRGGGPNAGSFSAPRRDDRGGRPAPRPDRDRQGGGQGGQGGQGSQGGRGPGGPGPRPPRSDRPGRDERPAPRLDQSSGAGDGQRDPWTEVPPELEEMLRAELARKIGAPEGARPGRTAALTAPAAAEDERASAATSLGSAETDEAAPAAQAGRRRATGARGGTATRRRSTVEAEPAPAAVADAGSPEPSSEDAAPSAMSTSGGTTRRRTASKPGAAAASGRGAAPATAAGAGDAGTAEVSAGPESKPRARRTATAAARGEASSTDAVSASPAETSAAAAKRPRAARRSTAVAQGDVPASEAPSVAAGEPGDAEAKPRRRSRRTTEALPSDS